MSRTSHRPVAPELRVMGVSSGTSMDAIDVAAIHVTETTPGQATMRLLGHWEFPWDAQLRAQLLAALPPAHVDAGEWCRLNTLVGQALGQAARRAMAQLQVAGHAGVPADTGASVDVVASHGQTMYHWVQDGRARGTLQLGDPAFIHEECGVPVISGLRAGDIAAGGQGAPLVAILDSLWLGGPDAGTSVALNIGGIANISVVDGDGPVRAWDTGPGNCLMDAAALQLTGQPCDRGGALAASGQVDRELLNQLLADPYYALPQPKSTGREYFDAGYVDRVLRGSGYGGPGSSPRADTAVGGGTPALPQEGGAMLSSRLAQLSATGRPPRLSTPDLLATLAELTAVTITQQITAALAQAASNSPAGQRVVVSGGGARNPHLMARLRAHLPNTVGLVTSDQLGLPVDSKEAYLFALLGYLSATGRPGTAPGEPPAAAATGARRRVVLGSATPPCPLTAGTMLAGTYAPLTQLTIAGANGGTS